MTGVQEVPCVIMRGGTSKAVFVEWADIPGPGAERNQLVMGLFGSGDPRQIDGLGGADVLTSKVAVMGPPTRDDADIDYTFGQVGIANRAIDWHGNCGNISSAAGVYAIEAGYLRPDDRDTEAVVRVHNTNTRSVLRLIVPVERGAPRVSGDLQIAGVPGSGAPIRLDFSDTAGASTGSIQPTGNPVDILRSSALGGAELEVSIVDVAKLAVFFRADDVGLTGTEAPHEFTEEVLARFQAIQRAAAELLDVNPDSGVPRPVSIAPPRGFTPLGGTTDVTADEVDFIGRWVVVPPPLVHKAYAGTGAVCTGVAARLEGTIVNQLGAPRTPPTVRIGHPSGIFPVTIEQVDGRLREASFSRTARRLMAGRARVRA